MDSVIKVYLNHDGNTDIRRVNVQNCAPLMKFEGLKEKIQMIYPVLRNKSFKITWKDSDEDNITIATDEDVATAFLEMTTKVFTVTTQDRNEDNQDRPYDFEGFIEGNVVCDVCENTITGYRYKCMQCPNYDLCGTCEHAGHHSQHMMIRASSANMPRYIPKLMTFMARSARKAGIQASKDAHRAAKMCARAASDSARVPRHYSTESGRGSHDRRGQCPIGEGFIYDLAAPFLEAVHNFAAPVVPTANTAHASQGAHTANTAPTAQASQGAHTAKATSEATATAPQQPSAPLMTDTMESLIRGVMQTMFTPQAQTPASSGTATPASGSAEKATTTVPMDVEQPKEREVDPGWTFVVPPQPQQQPQPEQQQRMAEQTSPAAMAMQGKIAEGLCQLHEMGFSDQLNLIGLLTRFDGNVGHVVKHLFENNQV